MTPRPTLRMRTGALLLAIATRLAVRGLRMVGAPAMLVRTPEFAREQDAAQQRMREAFARALGGSIGAAQQSPNAACPCPDCTRKRSAAASPLRWN